MANIINQYGQVKLGVRSTIAYPTDSDAQAFITAAAITDATQQSAIITLVTQLKTYGIWSKMKALYPFVGGTAAQHRFNLKDPRTVNAAFYLDFLGGGTHSATGYQPNGTTSYADTKLIPSSHLTINEGSLGFYSRTNNAGAYMCEIGSITTSPLPEVYFQIHVRFTNNYWYCLPNTSGTNVVATTSDSTGFYQGIRLNSTTVRQIKNTTFVDNVNNYTAPNSNVLIASRTQNISNPPYSNRECAFAYIGNSLTTTDAANFYTVVQKFQTTLGRQIGSPIVSDTDAQAFLNAAVITDATQANAVNTLVTDLKAANIWTKMKALYPFVGGTAAQHRFNLKDPRAVDAAYYLTFYGGGTHSANGYLPNGNSYADTKLIPSVDLSTNSGFGYYSITNSTTGNQSEMGAINYDMPSLANVRVFQSAHFGNVAYFGVNSQDSQTFTDTDTRGFYQAYRTDSTTFKTLKNSTLYTSILPYYPTPLTCYLGARNERNIAQLFSSKGLALAYFQSNFTDADATAFYTAVQKYQTTLGRAV
jgi:hypothetical protein